MKTLALTIAVVVAFTVSSSFAQTCPGGGCGGCGKKKDTSTNSTGTNSTAIVQVAL